MWYCPCGDRNCCWEVEPRNVCLIGNLRMAVWNTSVTLTLGSEEGWRVRSMEKMSMYVNTFFFFPQFLDFSCLVYNRHLKICIFPEIIPKCWRNWWKIKQKGGRDFAKIRGKEIGLVCYLVQAKSVSFVTLDHRLNGVCQSLTVSEWAPGAASGAGCFFLFVCVVSFSNCMIFC